MGNSSYVYFKFYLVMYFKIIMYLFVVNVNWLFVYCKCCVWGIIFWYVLEVNF